MIKHIIFDWKRTLYDPETKELLPGALRVLRSLSERDIELVLIGKGGVDMDEVLDSLDARKYFKAVHFVPAKSDELFERYISKEHPEVTLVVGDRAQGEVAIGKGLGAKAIWIRAGQFKDEMPSSDDVAPDETIMDIRSLLNSIYLR
jgi:FMN phosphatase YigB (HAD superfamily)